MLVTVYCNIPEAVYKSLILKLDEMVNHYNVASIAVVVKSTKWLIKYYCSNTKGEEFICYYLHLSNIFIKIKNMYKSLKHHLNQNYCCLLLND